MHRCKITTAADCDGTESLYVISVSSLGDISVLSNVSLIFQVPGQWRDWSECVCVWDEWVWVETSKVPMPCRPLGSSGGRCDVWGLAALPSSLLLPFPLAWCPPLHVLACLLPVYWGGEDSHPSLCLPHSINTNTTGTTLTFIWQNKLLTLWPVQLDRNFLYEESILLKCRTAHVHSFLLCHYNIKSLSWSSLIEKVSADI